jgi:prepilin-type N-terminal cleavage/methylation domain-containing protein
MRERRVAPASGAQRAAGERSFVARGRPRAGTHQAGFTLIEVLLAVLLLGLVVGSLVVSVQQNLAALVGARAELERLRLAESKLRELESAAEAGTPPEVGRTQGVFDPPDDAFAWELDVAPWGVPIPPELARSLPPQSSVFALPVDPDAALQPSVQRIEYRIYPADGTRDDVDPFITLLVAPAPPDLAAAAAGEAGDGSQTGGAGQDGTGAATSRSRSRGRTPRPGTPAPGANR